MLGWPSEGGGRRLPMTPVVFSACRLGVLFLALLLAACSDQPMLHDVLAQAAPGGQVAFDVVKLDDAVLNTVLARPQPAFGERFKKYLPPSERKIAVGDIVSVVIWESAANGLFGTSLTELSVPAGATARLLTGELPAPIAGVPTVPQGVTASPETFGLLTGAPSAELSGAQGFRSVPVTISLPAATSSGGIDAGAAATAAAATGLQSQALQALLRVAEQTGRAGTRIPDQQVGPDAAISIPYAGRIAVAGRTPAEVEHTIESRLGSRALDPQALVIVKRSAANSVSVAGEVIGGARVPLSPGGDRLLQVIAAAGGAKAPVHETFVRLSRDGVTATVPLATLVANPEQDIFAEPGDVLTLVRQPQTFSVFGATGKNSTISFISDRLSLSEALARAGGLLDEAADPRAVFLFRYEPVGLVRALGQPIATGAPDGISPVVYRLDLKEAKSYLLAGRFPVHDKDIIFVASAEIRPIYRFFDALNQISGPIQTGLVVCQTSKGC